jgi:uncharacterized RDD family membrane protein YckC
MFAMHYPGQRHWSSDAGVHFETPENVLIRYPVAGAGTRFLAFLVDWLLVLVAKLVILVVLLIVATSAGSLEAKAGLLDGEAGAQTSLYFYGLFAIIWTFGTFAYSFLCERFLDGQTLGKRVIGLRVVKANGFSLDASSLLIRNLFRVVDHLPFLWPVLILSERTQRAGDMAAGTIVVLSRVEELSAARRELAGRDAIDCRYRFDLAMLERLRSVDVRFVEELLDRWDSLSPRRLNGLINRTVPPLCRRLRTDLPPKAEVLRFLEDLIAAEYRRRSRSVV